MSKPLTAAERRVANGYGFEKIPNGHRMPNVGCQECSDNRCAILSDGQTVLCFECFRFTFAEAIEHEKV